MTAQQPERMPRRKKTMTAWPLASRAHAVQEEELDDRPATRAHAVQEEENDDRLAPGQPSACSAGGRTR